MDALDPDHLLEALDGDRGLVAEIVRTFLRATPELVDATRRAAGSGDLEGVRRNAHQLRGSLATVGAGPAARAAAKLETAGRDGAPEAVPAAMAALDAEITRLLPELQGLAGPGSEPAG
jgi:HPt (histidine-containing phosphotransfer) domain-containing protein